ncbi:MAG: hypothetical protein ACYTGR_04910 [Planctomycetota bacterium]|jgi:hypothetical protein
MRFSSLVLVLPVLVPPGCHVAAQSGGDPVTSGLDTPPPHSTPLAGTVAGGTTSAPKYELVRVLDVAGRQGVATDGERYYVSGSTALYVYSKDGALLRSNEDPFADLDKPANHIGDIGAYDGELYTGIEWFEDGRGRNIQIAVYDSATLTFKRSFPWNPDSGQVEVSALAVDPTNGLVWMTDWVNGTYVYRYRLSDGGYAGKLHLRPVPQWQQGLACFDGALYITADDGVADDDEADNLWKVPASSGATAAYVRHELAFDQLRDLGEIEGIDFDRAAGEMLVLANRGKRIVLGMPKGLSPGYDREISEIYVFRMATPPAGAPGDERLNARPRR